MKVSLNWLNEFISIDDAPETVADRLTRLGLEVEGVHRIESIPGGLKGVVIGEVIECKPHPNADKLVCTKVDVDEEELLSIVCGAPNVAKGQKVLVARVGTTIHPMEGAPMKIRKAEIRGQQSEGMICSEDELSLGTSHEGIIVVSGEAGVGTPAADYYEVESDVVIDIDLTPNRMDATHHLGVARDLAAFHSIRDRGTPELHWPKSEANWSVKQGRNFSLDIRDGEACPRYGGVLLGDIEVGPSPRWIQNRLKAIGISPKNNIVDITNYVLHELGQPLHAFDEDKMEGEGIVVRTFDEETSFTTLDGEERILTDEDLMICDGAENPLCMAGVFGGTRAEVGEGTENIFLESAHFDARRIRRTSMHHLLRTDAAKIFEKGSDPAMVQVALNRAVYLLEEYAGATITSDRLDHYPRHIPAREIEIRTAIIDRLLGFELKDDLLEQILKGLSIEVVDRTESSLIVQIPTDKADVCREVDVIEEILRIYGYDEVPQTGEIRHQPVYSNYPEPQAVRKQLAGDLTSRGFSEMMGLSLAEGERYDENRDDLVGVLNTSNRALNIMRPELMGSGLKAICHNQNRGQVDLRLFEFGRGYRRAEEDYDETEYLMIWLTGRKHANHWLDTEEQPFNFYSLKAEVHAVLHRCGLIGFQSEEIDSEDSPWAYGLYYHRGPHPVATFGQVARDWCTEYEVDGPVFCGQIHWQALYDSASKQRIRYSPPSRFPTVERDLAIILNEAVSYAEVKRQITSVTGDWLREVRLFDTYRDEEQLGPDKKSYAVRIVFEHPDKTLSDGEVNREMEQILEGLKKNLDAQLR